MPSSPVRWDKTQAFDAGSLWKMTAGWPVAVHASLVSLAQSRNVPVATPGSAPTHIPLADYVAEEILDQLEPSLAEFILRATTSDWLGRRLAVELVRPSPRRRAA